MERTFTKLRLQLTQNCNYACSYCMEDGDHFVEERLQLHDLMHILACLRDAGISALRLTGGEPLLYPQLPDLLARLPELAMNSVGITSNGQSLEHFLPALHQAQVQHLNISIDTLDAGRFRELTKHGNLNRVLSALRQAIDMGFKVKINTVAMKNFTEDQLDPLLTLAAELDVEVRFLELMAMGHLQNDKSSWRDSYLSAAEMISILGDNWRIEDCGRAHSDTAHSYQAHSIGNAGNSGKTARFGIIANTSMPFCSDCNRLRLTSEGWLYGCLSDPKAHDVRSLTTMTVEQGGEYLRSIVLPEALKSKKQAFSGEFISMRAIGG